jgi:hypothetical protein
MGLLPRTTKEYCGARVASALSAAVTALGINERAIFMLIIVMRLDVSGVFYVANATMRSGDLGIMLRALSTFSGIFAAG